MVAETPDEQALSNASDEVTEATRDAAISVVQAADKAGIEVSPDISNAAILRSLSNMDSKVTAVVDLVTQQTNTILEQLNAFSRSLANTDISAQNAADAAETVEEIVTPESESSPNEGEHPAQVQELPKRDIESNQRKSFWFGKAAYRHGSGR